MRARVGPGLPCPAVPACWAVLAQADCEAQLRGVRGEAFFPQPSSNNVVHREVGRLVGGGLGERVLAVCGQWWATGVDGEQEGWCAEVVGGERWSGLGYSV